MPEENARVSEIIIGNRKIGTGQPVFVIAEAGVNHNGDLDMALRLVDLAVQAGADAVKFQTWVTEKLMTPNTPLADYQRKRINKEKNQFEMAKQLELSYEQFEKISRYAKKRGILFLSTPDEEYSADFLDKLQVPLFKIGSGEVTNLNFLNHIARKGRPIILSTGLSTLGEVETAVHTIESAGNNQLILLHCVSDYPAEPSNCNLRVMDTLSSAFGYPVGFSDHSLGILVALAAVARGACLIEKHITLDKNLSGPDHKSSLSPEELIMLVSSIRIIESSLGDGIKRLTASESATKLIVQKSIVATRQISAGEYLTNADISLKRTKASGLSAKFLPLVIGRRLKCNLESNSIVELEMLD